MLQSYFFLKIKFILITIHIPIISEEEALHNMELEKTDII